MPYKLFGTESRFNPDLILPLNLKHKPVYAMPYQYFDGPNVEESDARYLSVGLAQWENDDLSLKIMRHTGEKWTRQAEELPLHRVFDAAIFLAKVLLDQKNNTVDIESGCFERQDTAIQVMREKLTDDQENQFTDYLQDNDGVIRSRLNSLYNTLDSLKKRGKF